MDPSIFKLLEEEEDEDESKLSKDDVDAYQASLVREIEGGNHSSSHQFAARNNGIQDANTNSINILESTQMEEQQQSALRNQDQELKPEDESHLQHNLPQYHLQPRRRCENPSHVPQASNLQSRNNSITTEPESPQKMTSQRTHGVEQPVGSVNHGPTEVQVCELIRILIPQVDKDRGKQLCTLFDKLKSKDITKDGFLQQMRDIVGNRMIRLETSKLLQLKQEDKGLKVPDGPNHYRQSFTSAEISAKRSDTCGVHVHQLPSTSSGTLSSSATVHGLHNSERPTSVNGPSMVQGAPIFHLENNSSLPLNSAPCQGSVTKDQTRSPSSSVVYVKQKSTDQSFDQVNFSAPSGTITAGSIVRTTPKMPCVNQKKPLEAKGSSLPPSSKRQRLCGTSFGRSDEKFNDVTELSGISLMEEERELSSSLPKKDSRVFNSFGTVVHEEEGRTILQKVPLQRKLKEIMEKSGLKHIKDDVERCLSLCVEERMRKLLSNIIRMSKQRTDPEKSRNRICITSDVRKQINEMNQKAKEEWEKKLGGKEKLKNEENDTAKKDNRSKQVKANNKEQGEKIVKAANVAALASVGGDNAFSKWKLMAEARQKPSSVLGSNSKKLSGGKRFGKNHGSPKVVRSISVKDVIAVVEKEPQMSRSTLLYRLCNMINSDVPTQAKA